MSNNLDELMDLDPLSLTSDNIDSIIAHHRKARSNAAAGIKAKKEKGPSADLSGIMLKLTQGEVGGAPKPTGIRRR